MAFSKNKLRGLTKPHGDTTLEETLDVVQTLGSQSTKLSHKELLELMKGHDKKVLIDANASLLGMAYLYAQELFTDPLADQKLKHDAAMKLIGHSSPNFSEMQGQANNGMVLNISFGNPEEKREFIDV